VVSPDGVLQRYPTVRGVLFDRPEVIEQAPATFDKAELTGRVDLVGGDFFESVPHGDALLIKSCLHNFPDDQATAILRELRRAISDEGVLLVAETVVPAATHRTTPSSTTWRCSCSLAAPTATSASMPIWWGPAGSPCGAGHRAVTDSL